MAEIHSTKKVRMDRRLFSFVYKIMIIANESKEGLYFYLAKVLCVYLYLNPCFLTFKE